MTKKILKYSFLVLVICYLAIAFVVIPCTRNNSQCKGILIEMSGNTLGTINRENIIGLLKEEGIDPNGQHIDSVKCYKIERFVNSMSLVKSCQVYKTGSGYVSLDIICRQPIIKVIDLAGNRYCIDNEGVKIEGVQKALFLPVATGYIDDSIATNDLREIAYYISGSPFWQAQIQQIYFKENGDVVLIPRVGEHIIELGRAENLDTKMKKLFVFYEKGLNVIGWNKYDVINIEFGDKVIGNKRE